MRLTVASWNINAAKADRFRDQLRFLNALRCDLALLQEVHRVRNTVSIACEEGWPIALSSHDVPPRRGADELAEDELGAMIVAGPRLHQAAAPMRLPRARKIPFPAPERTIVAQLASEGVEMTAASLYTVTGDERSVRWGPEKKRETNATWAAWLAKQTQSTVVGLDANAPRVDHPDEAQNGYWGDEYGFDFQRERLIFDRTRAPHTLRDVYRRYLEEHPRVRARVLRERPPDGPIATSHVNLGRDRRYDFLFATPDVQLVRSPRYLSDVLVRDVDGERLSDHAPVVARIELPSQLTP